MGRFDTTDSRPARPILASALSPSVGREQPETDEKQGNRSAPRWELSQDLDDGVALLSSGRVVGLSPFLPSLAQASDWRQESLYDVHHGTEALTLRMLIDFLSKEPYINSNPAKAFVIQFYDSQALSSEYLSHTITERYPSHTFETVKTIMDNVKVLRASRFTDILEAVDQISDILFQLQQQPKENTTAPPVLLLIEGIDQSLQEVIRASTSAAASSQMVPLLRTLTLLSRTYESFLTIMVVNSMPIRSSLPHPNEGWRNSGEDSTPAGPGSVAAYDPNIPVQSIFSPSPSVGGLHSVQSHAPSSNARPPFIFPLAQSLDLGFDVHLLVSKVQNSLVAEVAKDRVGDALGRWCVL